MRAVRACQSLSKDLCTTILQESIPNINSRVDVRSYMHSQPMVFGPLARREEVAFKQGYAGCIIVRMYYRALDWLL